MEPINVKEQRVVALVEVCAVKIEAKLPQELEIIKKIKGIGAREKIGNNRNLK